MEWFFIALGAPFLWSLVNISDKYLVTRYAVGRRGSGGLVLFSCLVGLFVSPVIFLFSPDIFSITFLHAALLILAGVITAAWIVLYLFTLEIEDISSVVPWFLSVPIFGYALGYIFLGETLSVQQISGSVIILSGLFLMSMDFSGGKNNFKSLVAFYMISACLLVALAGIIFKYVAIEGDFWVSSFWEHVGLGFSGIFIFAFVPKLRAEFIHMMRQGGKNIFMLNTASELVTTVGNLLTNFATLLAPIAMVYLVGSFQPAIMLVLAIFGTKFFPNIIKEDLNAKTLVPKICAIAVMVLGSAVLFWK